MNSEINHSKDHLSRNNQDLKVFISYSREDMEFADELVGGLEIANFEPTIDRHSIHEGEDWKFRLGSLIADADTVIFILSPDSARSDICAWEVEEAHRLSKRILPVLTRPLGDVQAPPRLASLNYVRFDEGHSFTSSLKALIRALNTDLDWLREHTRLLARAREWDQAGRPENRLLFGNDIQSAKEWIAQQPKEAPVPTELHHDFISESDQNESERLQQEKKKAADLRRAINFTRVALVVAIFLGLVAGLAGYDAYRKGQREIEAREEAENETKRANQSAREAKIAKTRFIADLARQQVEKGDAVTGVLLALEGIENLPSDSDLSLVPELRLNLSSAWSARRELMMLVGHEDDVTKVVYSPDQKHVFTASLDMTIRKWNLSTGKQTQVLQGHEHQVTDIALSQDGRHLISGSWDHTVRVWDANSGKIIRKLEGVDSWVDGVDITKDGDKVLALVDRSRINVWDLKSGSLINEVEYDKDWKVENASFSPDGEQIIIASWDKTATVWDISSGQQLFKLGGQNQGQDNPNGHIDWVLDAQFSPDGKTIATSSTDNTALIWNVATRKVVLQLKGHESHVLSVAFNDDGSKLLTTSLDGSVRIWATDNGSLIDVIAGHEGSVSNAVFGKDGNQIATASEDWTTRIWQVSASAIDVLQGHDNWLTSAQYTHDGQNIITASTDGTVRLWDAETGAFKQSFAFSESNTPKRILFASLSPDGSLIAAANNNKLVYLLDLSSGKVVKKLSGHTKGVMSARFSPDNKWIASASGDGSVIIWNAETFQIADQSYDHRKPVNDAVFSPDGKTLLTTSSDKTAKLWEIENGKLKLKETLYGHSNAVIRASFSNDGTQISTSSFDGTIRIWDANNGELLQIIDGHKFGVYAAQFSPNGQLLVSAGRDNIARLWDIKTKTELAFFKGHTHELSYVAFRPDGKRIVTTSADQTARIWSIPPPQNIIANNVKGELQRCLTTKQRKRFRLSEKIPDWCKGKWPIEPFSVARLAADAFQTNKPDVAYSLISKAISEKPRVSGFLVLRGKLLFDKGDIVKARDDFTNAINLNKFAKPSIARFYNLKGVSELDLNKYDKALKLYDEAIALDPDIEFYHSNRGLVHRRLFKYNIAVGDYSRAIKLNDKNYKLYESRGDILRQLGRNEEAVADYGKALRINPKLAAIQKKRGEILYILNNKIEAEKNFDAAIKLDPNLLESTQQFYSYRRDYKRQLPLLNEMIRKEPNNGRYLMNRAKVLYAQKDKIEAEKQFASAVKLNPKLLPSIERFYSGHFDYKRQLPLLDQMIRREPDNGLYLMYRAEVLYAQNDKTEAEKQFASAVKLDPNLLPSIERFYFFRRDNKRRLPLLEELIRKEPNNGRYLMYRAEILYDQNERSEAEKQFKSAVKLDLKLLPTVQQFYFVRKDYKRQMPLVNEQILTNPNDAYGYLNRAEANYELGNKAEAEKDFEKSMQLNYTVRERVSAFYSRKKNYVRAIEIYSEAIKKDGGKRSDYIGRANAYSAAGQFEKAIEDYNYVIGSSPKSTYALYLRGVAYEKVGQKELAIADYNHALNSKDTLDHLYYRPILIRRLKDLGETVEESTDPINSPREMYLAR